MINPNEIPLTSFQDFTCDSPRVHGETAKALIPLMDKTQREMLPICNGREFVQVVRLKTYKGILSKGQRLNAQITVFKCCSCGAIHDLNAKP